MTRGLLLYDADCGFCTRAVSWAPRLRLDVEVAALQATDLPAYGVDAERALLELPYVAGRGRVVYGHEAVAAALATGPAPMRVVGFLLTTWPVSRLAARVYAAVARHRHRLPGGTATCELR